MLNIERRSLTGGPQRTAQSDLSAAYRIKDASAYPRYYGFEHTQPELLAEAVFGLPELHRTELKGARLVATPGCHVTTATLALRPLVAAGLVETTGIVIDTMTGVTGAGRAPTDTNVFANIDANVTAYGLHHHRHTPEMEQEIGAQVLFTPHLVPMSRGLLATAYARPTGVTDTEALRAAQRAFYADAPFVAVIEAPPATKSVLGSNAVHVSTAYDERTGTVIAMAALDNLTKGASGGAIHAANIALGLDEMAGLVFRDGDIALCDVRFRGVDGHDPAAESRGHLQTVAGASTSDVQHEVIWFRSERPEHVDDGRARPRGEAAVDGSDSSFPIPVAIHLFDRDRPGPFLARHHRNGTSADPD